MLVLFGHAWSSAQAPTVRLFVAAPRRDAALPYGMENVMTDDLFSLQQRVALVTGGNRGLGRAIALGLQRAGARVAVTGRDAAQNARIGHELAEQGAVFALDVRD